MNNKEIRSQIDKELYRICGDNDLETILFLLKKLKPLPVVSIIDINIKYEWVTSLSKREILEINSKLNKIKNKCGKNLYKQFLKNLQDSDYTLQDRNRFLKFLNKTLIRYEKTFLL